MKKIILSMVFVFASFAMVNANSNDEKIENKPSTVERVAPDCWAGANAAEIYSCGSVGCNFDL